MSYSYKQWSADQTADNVIHASDLERWQDGITDAGGTWSGSWTDEKDTLTADQLNALETEIASLYGTGFTAKTWEDGQVPGVDEWNRIEDAINTILNRTAFAIYCETDNSLTFYVDTEVPAEGDTYEGKTVTAVYTNLLNTAFSSSSPTPWSGYTGDITAITIDSSFGLCKPRNLARWFENLTNDVKFTGLNNMDTSSVTNMQYMFSSCSNLTSLDVSKWDTSSVTNMQAVFYACPKLISLDVGDWDTSKATDMQSLFNGCNALESVNIENWDTGRVTTFLYLFRYCRALTSLDLSKWNTGNVESLRYAFDGCSGLTLLDLSSWDTSKVTNMGYTFQDNSSLKTIYAGEGQFVIDNVEDDTNMFTRCNSLVGGNGTTYDSSKIDSSMAHIDTEDNPGYFTAKG